jgi:hypothetical protein
MEEQAFNTSDKMARTPQGRLREIRHLQGVLSQQSFEPEQILSNIHRRRLVVAAQELGEDSDQQPRYVGWPALKEHQLRRYMKQWPPKWLNWKSS